MTHPIPSQIFDGSYFEALSAAAPEKGAPAPSETSEEALELDAEYQDFDWDAYIQTLKKRLPDAQSESLMQSPVLTSIEAQLKIIKALPLPIIAFVTHDLPPKSLWEYLNADEVSELKRNALRGFQQTPGSLRREPVQKRLAAWLQRHPQEFHLLLLRWGLRDPQPPALANLLEHTDDEAKNRLYSIVRACGIDAAFAAIAFVGEPKIFFHLRELLRDPSEFVHQVENAPALNHETPADLDAATPPEPDSPAAHFWHEQTAVRDEKLEKLDEALRQIEENRVRVAASDARIRALETDAAKTKERQTQNAAQAAKRLAGAEKKWTEKYDELERTHGRSERRLRALLSQVEELEHENKRQKKQIRTGAQAREEERKKVVLLEARLSELLPAENAPKALDARAPMNAVSSPPTTQDAPNRPVVVERPSPLDEIFEWKADGRRIRVTAREVRRLIDKNDEDSVADIMLALEALQGSNPKLRGEFLARLSQAGPHYPRVLCNRTTRVLVDASNVARFCPNRYGKGRLSHLLSMRAELQRLDCWPIEFIADASLPHFIDKPHELRDMARSGEVLIVDKGVEADEVLAREARKTGAYVVTNDAKFFYKVSPDYEPPRISFRVHDDLVIVDEF